MYRRALISVQDIISEVQKGLEADLGGTVPVSQIKSLAESVLDIYCHGAPRGRWHMTPRDVLLNWVAVAKVDEVERDLTQRLLTLVQSSLGLIYPSRTYRYWWFNDRDLVIEEAQRPLELSVPDEDTHFDPGYTPERQRRG